MRNGITFAEGNMEKFFCVGIAVGMAAGALLAVNSYKFRKFVCDSQKQILDKVDKITGDKKANDDMHQEVTE